MSVLNYKYFGTHYDNVTVTSRDYKHDEHWRYQILQRLTAKRCLQEKCPKQVDNRLHVGPHFSHTFPFTILPNTTSHIHNKSTVTVKNYYQRNKEVNTLNANTRRVVSLLQPNWLLQDVEMFFLIMILSIMVPGNN